jgi:hypothetical protein
MKARGSVFVHPMEAQVQSISRDNKRGALDGRGGTLKCEV